MKTTFTDRELHTILAALRAYQHLLEGASLNHQSWAMPATIDDFVDIATSDGGSSPMTSEEIDQFIDERLYQ